MLRSIVIFLLLLLHCNFSVAAEKNDVIDIKSDELIINRSKNTATYKHNVVINFEDMTLWTEKLIIYFDKNKDKQSITKIALPNKIKAKKNCTNDILVSDRGNYDNKTKLLTLTQNVKMQKNGHFLYTDEMTYQINIKKIK